MKSGLVLMGLSLSFLHGFGALYAIRICLKPFKPTVAEVIVGCFFTLIGGTGTGLAAHWLHLSIGYTLGAFWLAFALTGTPMFVGQYIKIKLYERQAVQELGDCEDADTA
jgi:hypothetical protein